MSTKRDDDAVGVRDDPGEKCPNCNTPLWRVTEREAGDELGERAQEYLQRALTKAREAIEAARAQCVSDWRRPVRIHLDAALVAIDEATKGTAP